MYSTNAMRFIAYIWLFLFQALLVNGLQERPLWSQTSQRSTTFFHAPKQKSSMNREDDKRKLSFMRNSLPKLKFPNFNFALKSTSSKDQHLGTLQPVKKIPLKIIIAGAPAAGKGTQCEVIKNKYGVVHLSTGDILRAAVKQGTELGLKAKAYMDAGQLVPDDLIISVVCDRLKQDDCKECGWLLDGFPRTKAQADALSSAGINPDSFVLLDVPEDILVERVVGRRTDPVTGKIYHLRFNPPENEEIAARLIQRSDDTEEKIKIRYREFKSHIESVQSNYEDRLIWIDGSLPQKDVTFLVTSSLDETASQIKPIVEEIKNNVVETLKIIIAGAPAAGKGTQCEVIKNKYGVVHLSTGDILRAAVKQGTELGLKAKAYMDAGQLVPDDLIISVVCDRLKLDDCKECGWLLDGFPRTKAQADALSSAGINPDCFVLLDVPEDILVERVVGRRTDPVTGKIYHLRFNPPENEEIASRLIQRSDDTEEKIKIRYREFKSHIESVQSNYEDRLIWIDGSLPQKDVTFLVTSSLDSLINGKSAINRNHSISSDSSVVSAEIDKRVSATPGTGATILNSKTKTVLGMAFLATLDRSIASLFASLKIPFPYSLAGMVGIFGALSVADKVNSKATEKFFYSLSFAQNFLKAWLVVSFVPPLVILPLKLHLIKNLEVRLLSVVTLGAVFSILSTGLLSQAIEKTLSKENQQSNSKVLISAPTPSLPPLRPFLFSTLSLFLASIAPLPIALRQVARFLYQLVATVTGYLVGINSPTSLKKVFHPILICATFTQLSLLGLSSFDGTKDVTKLMRKYLGTGTGPGDLVSSLLGVNILCFGLQLFQYKGMLFESAFAIIATTFFAALSGLFSSAVLSKWFQLQPNSVALASLTRCITSPLALAGAGLTGADPSLSAIIVVLTGIIGASFGESLLKCFKVVSPLSVGLSIGAGAHGLGTATLSADNKKFSAAVISMTLTGLWTVGLLTSPPLRNVLIKLATP